VRPARLILADVIAVGEAGGDLAAAVFDRIGQPQLAFGRSERLVVPLGGQSAGEAVTDSGLVAGWVVRSGHRDVLLAPFRGSMGGARLSRPVTGMVRFGSGYLMVGEDGGIFNFSDRPFLGSLGASPPPSPITAVAALDQQ
jgi:hypothetical protein